MILFEIQYVQNDLLCRGFLMHFVACYSITFLQRYKNICKINTNQEIVLCISINERVKGKVTRGITICQCV